MTASWRQGANAPLRARLAGAGAIGCVAVWSIGRTSAQWLQLGPMYPWKAAAVFAAMTVVAFAFLGDHPFSRLGPANRVTAFRAAMVALMAALIGEPQTRGIATSAVVVAMVTTVLDGVDGWLARRSRMASGFGGRIDMETDALLIMVLSMLVWQHGKAGVWVLAGGLMRYAFVAAGWLLPWMAGLLIPTRRARVITIVHLVGLSVALAPLVSSRVATTVVAASLTALTWSFAVDVGRLWRREEESAL